MDMESKALNKRSVSDFLSHPQMSPLLNPLVHLSAKNMLMIIYRTINLEPTKMNAHPIRQMLNGSRSLVMVMVLSMMSMMACRRGLMTTFKRYQWIFDLVTENGCPRPRPPANRTRAFPAHSLVSTMTTAWRVLHLTVW
jgi:hypothetical protein